MFTLACEQVLNFLGKKMSANQNAHTTFFTCEKISYHQSKGIWQNVDWTGLTKGGLDSINKRWTGLDWQKVDWTRLTKGGLDSIDKRWTGLNWQKVDWTRLTKGGLDSIDKRWTGLDWQKVDWTQLTKGGLDSIDKRWTGLDWQKVDWTRLTKGGLVMSPYVTSWIFPFFSGFCRLIFV